MNLTEKLGVTQDLQYLLAVLLFTKHLEVKRLVAVAPDDHMLRARQQTMVDTTITAQYLLIRTGVKETQVLDLTCLRHKHAVHVRFLVVIILAVTRDAP